MQPHAVLDPDSRNLYKTSKKLVRAGAQQQRVVQFSAGQPDAHQHRPRGQRQASGGPGKGARRKLTVAELPSYGDKHRRTPREAVPHEGGLLQGFSPWIEVSFFTWRVRSLTLSVSP